MKTTNRVAIDLQCKLMLKCMVKQVQNSTELELL
jgi:hypothetical protein